MPRALALALRERVVQWCQQGRTLGSIARELGVGYRTVQACWSRFRRQGQSGLAIGYQQCGPKDCAFPKALREAALDLKQNHPRWGAGLIRLELSRLQTRHALPCVRTLQRWFQSAGLQPGRAKRPPVERRRGELPHDVWEIDAKERMRLADGSGTCVLCATDEASGALLGAEPFPPVPLEPGAYLPGADRLSRVV